MLNPFVVGAYVSEKYFCGRSKEMGILQKCIREDKNVVLYSERRLGKSHLIKRVFHEAQLDFSQVCERSSQWCELRYSQVQTAH